MALPLRRSRAGTPRRIDRHLPAAEIDLDLPRRPGRDLLLHQRFDRLLHLALLRRPAQARERRRACRHGVGTDRARVRADPRRRADAASSCGTRDSRLPALLRALDPALHVDRDHLRIHASRRRGARRADGDRHGDSPSALRSQPSAALPLRAPRRHRRRAGHARRVHDLERQAADHHQLARDDRRVDTRDLAASHAHRAHDRVAPLPSRCAHRKRGSGMTTITLDGARPGVAAIARDYFELSKSRIVLMVLITTAAGFLFAAKHVDPVLPLHALIGTALVAAGTNALNQYVERDLDAKMHRTRTSPLPAGRMSPRAALVFSSAIAILGTLYLGLLVNWLTAILGAVTLTSYIFVYTPLKRVSTICTLIGAIPGAIPPLMGWTAATNTLWQYSAKGGG